MGVLRQYHLFAKRLKCRFIVTEIDYMDHFIFGEGVKADTSKISTMLEWFGPTNLKSLRGFLRLTGYYKNFIKDYGKIAAPLIGLLKKNGFERTNVATEAF